MPRGLPYASRSEKAGAGTIGDVAGVTLTDHRDRPDQVSGLRGEDEEERALPGAAVRKGEAAQRTPFPVRDAVLNGNRPVRSDGPFYRPRTSSSGLTLPREPLDLPACRSMSQKEPLPVRPSFQNP